MMDDSMEISSEHGHNIHDEDIDIDIDLTVDEDYILEDAVSQAPFDEDFNFQPSATGNDDLMVDEEDESYPMNEIDTDLIPDDHSQNMDDEPATAEYFTADHVATSYLNEHDGVDTDHFEVASTREAESTAEHKDALNGSVGEADVHSQQYEEPTIHEEEAHITKVNTAETEAPPPHLANNDSRPVSPPNHSPSAPTITEHPQSPSISLPKSTDEPKHTVSQDNLDASPSHEHGDVLQDDSEGQYVTEESNTTQEIPQIFATYQNVEYSLFSTSELDDPDTFFLSDLSILDAPIAKFLQAIRDVTHEDLAEDDELCLSIDDLGIGVEESSTLIQGITLKQILNLYESLLRNDGVESPVFRIQFVVRPNFLKRLANLAADAANGGGLSELIYQSEPSNSLVGSTEVVGDNDGEGTGVGIPEPQEFDEVEKEHEDAHDISEIPHAPAPDTDLRSTKSGGSPSDKPVAEKILDATTKPSQKDGSSDAGHLEDDLIDYSDEEVETPDKPERNNRAINQKPQGDSVSYAAENNLLEQSTEQTEGIEGGSDGQEGEAVENGIEYEDDHDEGHVQEADEIENGVEYEDDHDESHIQGAEDIENNIEYEDEHDDDHYQEAEVINYEDHDEGHVQETRATENGIDYEDDHDQGDGQKAEVAENGIDYEDDNDEVHYTETEAHDREPEPLTTDTVSGADYEGSSLLPEPQDEPKHDGELVGGDDDILKDEIEYEDYLDAEIQEPPKLSDEDLGLEGAPDDHVGSDHADLGNMSPSESDKTLEALAGTDEANEDEIDYDDDDDQIVPVVQEPAVNMKESPFPLDGPGKRQREDANLDEGLSMRTDAKRPRP